MPNINIAEEEWQVAYKLLEKAADGTKLPYSMCYEENILVPRKRYQNNPKTYKTTHSFIKIHGEIYALAQGKKTDANINKGSTAKLKYACNKAGEQFLIKISNWIQEKEANIMMDLSQSVGFNERSDKSKFYIALLFLGTDLENYLTQNHAILNEDQRFDIAIKLCWQVFCLHEGLSSKTSTPYAHYDIKHDNVTIDKDGNIHLIDYGYAEEKPNNPAYIKSDAAAYMPDAKPFQLTGEQIDVVSLKRTLFAPESYYCSSGFENDDVKHLFCYRIMTKEMLVNYKLTSYINTGAQLNDYPDYQKEHIPAKTLCALLVAAKLKLNISNEEIKNNPDLALTISSLYMCGKAMEIEQVIESEEDVKLIGALQKTNRISRLEEYKAKQDLCYLITLADSLEKRLALIYIDELGFLEDSKSLIESNNIAVAIIDVKNRFKDPDKVKNYIKKLLNNNIYADSYNFLNKHSIKEKSKRKNLVSIMEDENEAALISNIDDQLIKRAIISLIKCTKYSYNNVLKLSTNKELAAVIIEFENNSSFITNALDCPETVLRNYKNCNLAKIESSEQLKILLSNASSNALHILVEAGIHTTHDLSKIPLSKIAQTIIKLNELNRNELYGFVVRHDTDKVPNRLAQILKNPCICDITANMISNQHMFEALYNTNNMTCFNRSTHPVKIVILSW
ncbi:hypothetical protein, partial [uncultured Legionella sp.]|uniref:hypothetical protein n=1 Tax=uncultured Legionella sp. TaxID=210934 RepID=UPI00260A7DC8